MENILITNKHILIIDENDIYMKNIYIKYQYEINNFCGNKIININEININNINKNTLIYLTGNINNYIILYNNIIPSNNINIIKELSYNYDEIINNIINIGQMPLNINNVGLYYCNYFDKTKDYFNLISTEHKFQELTESNKPTNALRKGIYITHVNESNNGIEFNLLRCSTNMNGPTDNMRNTDNEILNEINNNILPYFYEKEITINHVLAQIYYSKIIQHKITKGKISAHSDKTKDMPADGVIVFCSFYENYINNKFNDKKIINSSTDNFDYVYNNKQHKEHMSILTKLRFRLKNDNFNNNNYNKLFDITLYPNSIFIISLEINKLYTHEIIPSVLSNNIPLRLGYTIRCSNTKAIYKNNNTDIGSARIHRISTYILYKDGEEQKLNEPNETDINTIKKLYYLENTTSDTINYGDMNFSLNNGDYMQPII